jgi:predicted metal-binding membrane protein
LSTQIVLPSRAQRIGGTPISRARTGILISLLVLTAVSWLYLANRGRSMHPHGAPTPTMGMGAGLFLLVWIAMTVASMFPAITQTVVVHARITANRTAKGRTSAPTSLFVSGYLLLWTALGMTCYAAAVLVERVAPASTWAGSTCARVAGGVIAVAGLYQFSKLKDRCLTECRSPLAFFAEHWQDGPRGALQMGLRHGLTCAGCCWALMVMLFPIGMTNIAAMAAVTVVIYAERVLPIGPMLGRAVGVALIGWGLAVIVHPGLLPGHWSVPAHVMTGGPAMAD